MQQSHQLILDDSPRQRKKSEEIVDVFTVSDSCVEPEAKRARMDSDVEINTDQSIKVNPVATS